MMIEAKELKQGSELTPLIHTTKLPRIDEEMSDGVHTEEGARLAGREAPIVPGMTSFGYMTELMTSLFGEKWFTNGKIEGKFIAPINVGVKILTRGIVTERIVEGNKVRLAFDLWCEGPDGQKVTVGTASCLI
jgi:hypothetical protein